MKVAVRHIKIAGKGVEVYLKKSLKKFITEYMPDVRTIIS